MMNLKELPQSIILIVDDYPQNLDVLREALEGYGAGTRVALNGKEAIERLEHLKPDIILLDIMMPDINGFETCRRLKQNETTRDIPVIFMTALNETVDELKGFECGAVDYITKPFKLERVLTRINSQLILQRQKKELLELNATKNRLFSFIAHEMGNAFSIIKTSVSLLDPEKPLQKESSNGEIITLMKNSAESTFKILENMLALARFQQGTLAYNPKFIDLADIVEINFNVFRVNAHKKQIQLSHEVSSAWLVKADWDMMDAVIRNLLNNAIKFTGNGGQIYVKTCLRNDDFVELQVTDTGIGMSKSQIENLFSLHHEPQTRLGTDNEKGSGLGLLVCKEFVEKNGGQIWVDSEEGKGSAFKFTIPLAKI